MEELRFSRGEASHDHSVSDVARTRTAKGVFERMREDHIAEEKPDQVWTKRKGVRASLRGLEPREHRQT